jgi:hypothetical protein
MNCFLHELTDVILCISYETNIRFLYELMKYRNKKRNMSDYTSSVYRYKLYSF